MSNYNTMCGIDQAIEWLDSVKGNIQIPLKRDADMPDRIIERMKYIRDKDAGVKPRFNKGIYGHKYDSWTCGNCGAGIPDVLPNYCRNCGYKILWDSTRCLTR